MTCKKFELKLREESVEIVDVKDATKIYVIRELSGAQRDAFLNDMGGRMKFTAAGKMEGLSDYTDLQTGFLALCLYDETGESVALEILREYPASVLSGLFEIAQKLSGLDKGAESKAKNES